MTFVHKVVPSFAGVPFGVEGDPSACALPKRSLPTSAERRTQIRKENKVLYHAFDTFASPLFIALMAALEASGQGGGDTKSQLRKMAGPCFARRSNNYLEHGECGGIQWRVDSRRRGYSSQTSGRIKEDSRRRAKYIVRWPEWRSSSCRLKIGCVKKEADWKCHVRASWKLKVLQAGEEVPHAIFFGLQDIFQHARKAQLQQERVPRPRSRHFPGRRLFPGLFEMRRTARTPNCFKISAGRTYWR